MWNLSFYFTNPCIMLTCCLILSMLSMLRLWIVGFTWGREGCEKEVHNSRCSVFTWISVQLSWTGCPQGLPKGWSHTVHNSFSCHCIPQPSAPPVLGKEYHTEEKGYVGSAVPSNSASKCIVILWKVFWCCMHHFPVLTLVFIWPASWKVRCSFFWFDWHDIWWEVSGRRATSQEARGNLGTLASL